MSHHLIKIPGIFVKMKMNLISGAVSWFHFGDKIFFLSLFFVQGQETTRRYENLTAVCRNVNGIQDLREYVKCMTIVPPLNQRHAFTLPAPLIPPADGGSLPFQVRKQYPRSIDMGLLDRIFRKLIEQRHSTKYMNIVLKHLNY
jgi:hypothetical protein